VEERWKAQITDKMMFTLIFLLNIVLGTRRRLPPLRTLLGGLHVSPN